MSHIHWDRHVSFEWCLKDVNDLCVGAQLFWFGQTVCAHLKFDFLQVWNQFAWSLICFEFEKTDRLMFHLLWVGNQFAWSWFASSSKRLIAWSLICFEWKSVRLKFDLLRFEKTDCLKFDLLQVGNRFAWRSPEQSSPFAFPEELDVHTLSVGAYVLSLNSRGKSKTLHRVGQFIMKLWMMGKSYKLIPL